MTESIKKAFRASLFFGVGFLVFYLVYVRQNKAYQEECVLKGISPEACSLLDKVISDMQSADYSWIGVVLGLFLLSNVFRTLRWKMMLRSMGYFPSSVNLFGTIMINYLVNLGIPRSGEIVRAGLISNYENIPVEKVLGTIFTDRIFDVICLFFVLVLTVIFGGTDFYNYLQANIDITQKLSIFTNHRFLWAGILLACIASFVWLYRNRRSMLQTSFGQRVWYRISGFLNGVSSVKNVSSPFLFAFHTLMIWVCYYFMMYLSFFSFTPTAHLGPVEGLVVFAFGSLGILFPSPGGMGSYHMLVAEGLSMYGLSGADGFSFANIVFFSVSVGINVVLGLLFLVLLPILNQDTNNAKN